MAPGRAIRPGATLSGPMTPEPTDARLRVDDFDYDLPATAIAQVADRATRRRPAAGARPRRIGTRPTRALASHLSRGGGAAASGRPAGGQRLARHPGPAAGDPRRRRAGGDPSPAPDAGRRDRWEALVRPSRRIAPAERLILRSGDRVEVGERLGDGTRAVRFDRDPYAVMADAGETPLPPTSTIAPPRRIATRRSMPGHPARRLRRPPASTSPRTCSDRWKRRACVGPP